LKKLLKYLVFASVVVSLWTIIWSSNATVSDQDLTWVFTPPDSTKTKEESSEELPFAFEDEG